MREQGRAGLQFVNPGREAGLATIREPRTHRGQSPGERRHDSGRRTPTRRGRSSRQRIEESLQRQLSDTFTHMTDATTQPPDFTGVQARLTLDGTSA